MRMHWGHEAAHKTSPPLHPLAESLTGREMSGTPRGVGAPLARRDEHGASAAESERSEDVRSIELLCVIEMIPLIDSGLAKPSTSPMLLSPVLRERPLGA